MVTTTSYGKHNLTISKRKFSKTVPLVVQTLFSLLLLFVIQNRISSSDADLIINL